MNASIFSGMLQDSFGVLSHFGILIGGPSPVVLRGGVGNSSFSTLPHALCLFYNSMYRD